MHCKNSNHEARRAAPGYFSLIAAGEPFRLLFPVGTLIGISGVMLWPLYVWNVTAVYPGTSHPRIMVEGFLTCFTIGFLGTALPRLLGVPRINFFEACGFAVALVCVTLLHFAGRTLWGDEVFFFTLATFVTSLMARAILRKDTPPPAFVLVLMGILSALTGSAILTILGIFSGAFPTWVGTLGRLLLNQGYLLLPVMGIGAFLLPRFFGLDNRQSFPESLALPPGWMRRAGFALFCGSGIIASFALEALNQARWGCALRGAMVTLFFLREVPVHRAGVGGGSLALGLRIAMLAFPSGYLLMALWPDRIFSFLHVVFITGFSLMVFVVASRVVLGHSGQSDKFRAWSKPVSWMVGLIMLAMLTRVSADWMPGTRMTHYAYAGLAWVAGIAIWSVAILPGVRLADLEK